MGLMANRGALVLCLGLGALAACGVGDDGPPSTPEPRICQAHFTVAGQFTMSRAAPDDVNNDTGVAPGDGIPDIQGCWPVGTWTFSLTQVDNTCKTAPTPNAEYKFSGVFVPDAVEPDYVFTLVTPDPTSMTHRVNVSSGGGGLCEGSLELYSADAKQAWILNPALNVFNMSGPLTGVAEYGEYKEAQYP